MAQAGGARLTTHVLDTALGKPANGLSLSLYRLDGERRTLLVTTRTDRDGRCPEPLLAGAAFTPGQYEIVFAAGDYLRQRGCTELTEPAFLDVIPIRFGVAEHGHYHVPLLLSPHGYTTYRGS